MTFLVNKKNCNDWDIDIGRPSPWGNLWSHQKNSKAPFIVSSRKEAVENHSKWLEGTDFTDVYQKERKWILNNLHKLEGKIIACYCTPLLCHGINYINMIEKQKNKKIKKPILKIMTTGHRPNKLLGYDENNPMQSYIKREFERILSEYQKDYDIIGISGMAQGVDWLFVKTCIKLNIPFDAYIPFLGQECKWPKLAQKEYHDLLKKARKIIVVSEGNYSPRKMQIRNEAMVDNCDIAIPVWNGDKDGGTANCVCSLTKAKKEMIRINPNHYNK